MYKTLFAVLFFFACSLVIAQQVMNNDVVIKLVKAGLSDDVIVSTINASGGSYDTSADALIALKNAGASDKVIAAVVAKTAAPAAVPAAAPAPAPAAGSTDPSKPADNPSASQQTNAIVISGRNVPSGAKLYIAPMQGSLDNFIAAEILKQKVPLTVVASDSQADLIMTGLNVKEDDHWYNAVWGGKDKNEGSVRMIGVQNKAIIWAGDAGDRSIIFGAYHRGGLSKVAERLVKEMRKSVTFIK